MRTNVGNAKAVRAKEERATQLAVREFQTQLKVCDRGAGEKKGLFIESKQKERGQY